MWVEVKDVSKRYGNLQVLRDFNIKFEEKTISALLGPSGCGKTTLLNIISGLEQYDSGNIKGIENKKFSYIFQEDRLVPWLSVEENIHFVLKRLYRNQEIINITDKYLKIVGLEEYKHYYPRELSGGMKQRVAIARAFAYPSDILLMDEPFKGLDMDLKTNLSEAFISLWKKDKKTVVFVTHDMNEAMVLADYVFILDGKPLAIKDKIVTED